MTLKMYESSEIYAIGYDDNGDFVKIATLNKEEITKTEASDIFNYLNNDECV